MGINIDAMKRFIMNKPKRSADDIVKRDLEKGVWFPLSFVPHLLKEGEFYVVSWPVGSERTIVIGYYNGFISDKYEFIVETNGNVETFRLEAILENYIRQVKGD